MSESKETENELLDLKHAVDRHDEAVTQDAAEIRKIKEQLVLVTEALEKIEIAAYRGSGLPAHEQALRRLKEIVAKLSAELG